jgi:predicted amidohydrolase
LLADAYHLWYDLEKIARSGKMLVFTGMNRITDPAGARLAQAGKDTEEIITAEINPALYRDKLVTRHNDIFKDRQPDVYFTN